VHYVRERVAHGEVSPCWVATNRMLADVLTKALPPFMHADMCRMLCLTS
jgi:hypothetical protein